jgi:exodeoxyribonuclease V alpha subunit
MLIEDPLTELLQGTVERVTFHSPQTGFCVLRAQVADRHELITVIGHAASVAVGEYVECRGGWINDKKHGVQFKAEHLLVVPPTTLAGIEKYLGSGMVRGIGPHFAKKLVQAFGEQVLYVIEHEPFKLTTLEGIGEKRKAQVVSAWSEQQGVRNIMVFLQSHGVGAARAARIYKMYGEDAIRKVRENPYRLALDIRGIGFKIADHLAEQLSIAHDSPLRAQAGVRHVLQELCDKEGHCAVITAHLVAVTHKLLKIDASIIEQAILTEMMEGRLVQDTMGEESCIYPVALYQAESSSAEHLLRLNRGRPPWGVMDVAHLIPWVEGQANIHLSMSQRQAIQTVLDSKIAIITGGPGVGKTTLINSILMMLRAKNLVISLCAPTGRAAKRLAETTNLQAKTIHRLLYFDPITYAFKYNEENPLLMDVLIIDESSMLDVVLLNHLLKAVPGHAAVIFVGDIDQLPSVGSGAVLADLIHSEVIATVRLTEVFRQAASSQIIVNAYRVNQGEMPLPNQRENSDFYTIYAETPEEIHRKLLQVVCVRLPQFYQCDPVKDIQVLTPMNRGGLGTRGLNVALQHQLNGLAEPKMTRFGMTFAPGDKVIQTVNNYDKDVFNGDIGVVEGIDGEEGQVIIRFDQQLKAYDRNELDEVSLAYAISIHKSQGSEFPIIVIPLSTQHYMLLARKVLYTGITRGKHCVVLIGQEKAIRMAVDNNKEAHRLTKLARRIQESSDGGVACFQEYH